MISPMLVEQNREFSEERKFSFDLLSDPGNETASAYGLTWTLPQELREVYLSLDIDLPLHNGDDSWTLPIPARYIIDQDRVIRYAEANADYTVRPDPEETIAALRLLEL